MTKDDLKNKIAKQLNLVDVCPATRELIVVGLEEIILKNVILTLLKDISAHRASLILQKVDDQLDEVLQYMAGSFEDIERSLEQEIARVVGDYKKRFQAKMAI